MAITNKRAMPAQATEPEIAAVAANLREQLGERLTAVIGGVTDAGIVRAWAAGDAMPEPATEQTLRAAYDVTHMLLDVDSAQTVRLWFSGMNPDLDDASPALVIADDPESVRSAARAYVAHG